MDNPVRKALLLRTRPALIGDLIFDVRLQMIAEGGAWTPYHAADWALLLIGFVRNNKLTAVGNDYYLAKIVAYDDTAAASILAASLKENDAVNTFCANLCDYDEVPVRGAISLLRRLIFTVRHDTSATIWLRLMNYADLIDYKPSRLKMRVIYHPYEYRSDRKSSRERRRSRLISPSTPYANLLALKKLLGTARKSICWYEQHMPRKVLELLHGEIDGQRISAVRLLSGPANIDIATKGEFQRFRSEMASERRIDVQWRVLSKDDARLRHGRFFISERLSWNMPPLNSILMGSVDEILQSHLTEETFNDWWTLGQDIVSYQVESGT